MTYFRLRSHILDYGSAYVAQCLWCYIWDRKRGNYISISFTSRDMAFTRFWGRHIWFMTYDHTVQCSFALLEFLILNNMGFAFGILILSAAIFNFRLPVCRKVQMARSDACSSKSLDTRTVDFCPISIISMSLELHQTYHSLWKWNWICSPKFVAMPVSGWWSRDHVQILDLSGIFIESKKTWLYMM